MKILVIIILVAIVFSLGSAIVYLVSDQGRSSRTVKALSFRIGLSVALFLLLLLAYAAGLIKTHGLVPIA